MLVLVITSKMDDVKHDLFGEANFTKEVWLKG